MNRSTGLLASIVVSLPLAMIPCRALADPDSGAPETAAAVSLLSEETDAAPAAPTELELDFKPGSLTGGIWFKAPGRSGAGDEITGNLDYCVRANGEQVAVGKVYVMSTRFVEFSVPAKGLYEISVTVSNADGTSPAASITSNIGYSKPAVPKVEACVEKGESGDRMRISWDAVTLDVSGKPLEGDVRYRVLRYPGEVEVCGLTAETSVYDLTLPVSVPGIYGYGVTAVCNDILSDEGESQVVNFGHIEPPYSESFDNEIDFAAYVNIDADGDGYRWEYYAGETIVQPGSESDCDDWLISPPVVIEKGKYYRVSVDMKVRSEYYPGRFELKYGNGAGIEDMTGIIIKDTEVSNEDWRRYSGLVYVDGEGLVSINLGLHAMTEAGGWWLHATRLNISSAMAGDEPAAPSGLTAVPDIDGDLSAEISLCAPSTDISGNPLAAISSVSVARDGVNIYTFDNPEPGQSLAFTDRLQETGRYTYTAAAFSEAGEGLPAETSAFVGMQLPAHPEEAEAYETATPGEVTVTWKRVTTYEDGTPLNPDNVSYNIWTDINGEDVKILTGIKETSCTFTIMANPEEEQLMWQFGVTAETPAGENLMGAMTPYTPVGRPYDTPYEDSFSNLECAYPYVYIGSDNLTYWDNASDRTFQDIGTQDGDNGMLVMYGREKGSHAQLTSGKISLKGLERPMLTFWTFNVAGDVPDTNTIDICVNAGEGFQPVKTIDISASGADGWCRVEADLSAFEGKSIQFRLVGTIDACKMILVDNLVIRDRRDHDLELASYEMPSMMKAGGAYDIRATVANRGLLDADGARCVLLRDGAEIQSNELETLPSDGSCLVSFLYAHPADAEAGAEFRIEVRYDADMNTANNTHAPVAVGTVPSGCPAVTDLKATYGDDESCVTLTWTAPQLSADMTEYVTETFDDCDPWARTVEGWTFLDRDGYDIYCFSTWLELPFGAPCLGSQESWWVFDSSYEPIRQHFSKEGFYASHSGDRCLVSNAVFTGDYRDMQSDDWAVSPLLPGIGQTVTLWAKSMLSDAPERFELLYSSAGTDPADFISVADVKDVPWEWTRYDFPLPEGARYFAIRSRSRDCFMLMIDDISFAAASASLSVEGYNVYRDGELITGEPVADTEYKDVTAAGTKSTYRVAAVLSDGCVSRLSNPATPEYSSVEAIERDMTHGTRLYNLQGIEVTSPRKGEILIRRDGDRTTRVIVK